jgi:hypothetical protein
MITVIKEMDRYNGKEQWGELCLLREPGSPYLSKCHVNWDWKNEKQQSWESLKRKKEISST